MHKNEFYEPEVFGELVRAARQELGISQKELGRRIGRYTWNYISRLERGVAIMPSSIILIRLAIALNVDLTDLLIKGKFIEGLVRRKQINDAVAFVRVFETSLDIKESARIVRSHLVSAIARSSETSTEVRSILKTALKNFDYIFDVCFDPKRPPLPPEYHGPATTPIAKSITKPVMAKSKGKTRIIEI